MLIAAAPTVIPVSTANVPTESVAAEVAQKTPIQEPKAASDSPGSRNSTDNNEQSRAQVEFNRQTPEEKAGQEEQPRQQSKEQREQVVEAREIEQLQQVDREVRAHERAHAGVGGELAGAPQYTYQIGPDGKRYAVAGEVAIDTGRIANDPEATIDKMLQVRRAALAPVNPSNQDLKVAAIASQVANQAQIELNIENQKAAESSKLGGSDEEARDDERARSLSDDQKNTEERSLDSRFDPFSARRAALALNTKIVDSGALNNIEREQLFSLTA